MKKGLIFATTLAMALGVGVAVGAHQKQAAEVKADYTSRTVYCAIDTTTLGSYTLKLNCNVGDNNTWVQSVMSEVSDTTSYPGKKIYKGTFEERYGGVDAMQFQLYDGDNWHAEDKVISGWKTYDNYSGKLHIYGGEANSWAAYTEPSVVTHTVHVYVDGEERTGSPETIADGALPDEPAAQWGKSFSGWCSDAECTVPAVGVTADITVYGKFTTLPTVTYTVDASKVSNDYAALYLWAWEPNGLNNAQNWPGVVVADNTITLPNDASFLINNGGNGHQTVNVTQSLVANDTLRILAAVDGKGYNEYEWASDDIPSVYKYRVNEGEYQVMAEGSDSQVTATGTFAKGDVLTFLKDDATFAVAPKDDDQQTKVYAVTGGLKFAEAYTGTIYLNTSTAKLWAGQFTAGYYLAGVKGQWEPKLALAAHEVAPGDPAYVVENVELNAGDELKYINFPESGNEVTYYTAVEDQVYTSTEVAFTLVSDGYDGLNLKVTNAGTYDVLYNPTSGWYSIEDKNYVEPVYTVQVGTTEYDLELNEGTEYKIKDHIDIKLNAGEEITVLKDGVEVEFERKKIGNNNLNADFEVIADAQTQVYIDLDAETIFAGGLTFGGYHLLVNNTFVQMTKNDKPMEGYEEYYSNMISFKKDDVIRFIDTSAVLNAGYAVDFDITKINSHSEPGVAVVGEGAAARLVAQQNVNLAVYLKLSMILGDEVYFGSVPEEVALAEEFAENFNDAMEAVCVYNNKDIAPSADLVTAWGLQVTAFGALDEKAQTVLKNAKADDSIKEIGDFVAKYLYIAGKYGDQLGEGYNFLAKDLKASAYIGGLDTFAASDNTTIIIVISIAAVSALAFTMLLVFKKRKQK